MTVTLTRGLCAAFTLAASTGAAFADLSAGDVWSDWKDYLSSTGYTVSANERMSGNVLTIDDMSVTMPMTEEGDGFSLALDGLTFTENGDGTVSIAMPSSIPMTFRGDTDDDGPVKGTLTYSQTGHRLTAAGDPDDLRYTYAAETVALELASLAVDGQDVPPAVAGLSLSLENVASDTRMTRGETRAYAQDMTADSLSYDFRFEDPDPASGDTGNFQGRLEGVGFQGTGTIPPDMNPDNLDQMLADGFEVDGAFTFASGASNIAGVDDGQAFALGSTSGGGRLGLRMDADQIAYDLEQTDTALSLQGGELPVPVEMKSAATGFNLTIPVATSEEPQDFAAGVTLTDFTMSDMLWSIFDPAGALPRDPASLALDLTGKAKVLADFLDPDVAETLEETDTPPVEVESVTINKLLVSLVGASLTGSGAFTLDNSDTTTFDGLPRPTGQIDLQLVGGNALLDKLVGLGVIGDEEAMAARMMMGLLAVPGDAPDTLNSKIEVTEQGQVLANGQRLK